MAYWWVSQGQTYALESAGKYLWAPGPDKAQRAYWMSLDRVQPGDLIFSYVTGVIVALITPTSEMHIAARPREYTVKAWEGEGRRIEAEYVVLPTPVPRNAFDQHTLSLLAVPFGPLNRNGTGNQGYLFPVTDEAAHAILALVDSLNGHLIVDTTIGLSATTATQREIITSARIGQGMYRSQLLTYWNRQCAVSGLSIEALLRASHIKSWRDSNNRERLDRFNGLLLGAGYDAAFDIGLVSFADDGRILFSETLDRDNALRLGIDANARLQQVAPQHIPYLQHHRALAMR